MTAALIATVILLVWMGFFALGSLPLLVLKHDTLTDARFIRGLFDVYYLAVTFTAAAAAAAYVAAGRLSFALGTAIVCGLAFSLRRWWILPRMDRLRDTEPVMDEDAIRQFRTLHMGGMALNLVQLVTLAWSLTLLGKL